MVATHQIPIYRFKDGFKGLRSNNESIQASVELMRKGKVLVVFPEGGTKPVRGLRPLQRGVARIVFNTLEKYPDMEIIIQPAGFHLSHMKKFRAEVAVQFGDPISITRLQFLDVDPLEASLELTRKIESALQSLVPHTGMEVDESLIDQLTMIHWHLAIPLSRFPVLNRESQYPFDMIRHIPLHLEKLDDSIRDRTLKISHHILQELRSVRFLDWKKKELALSIGGRVLFLLLGFIPFCVAVVATGFPCFVGKYIADRFVKKDVFYVSVAISVILVIYLAYLLLWLVLSLIYKPILALIIPVIPVLIYWMIWYAENWTRLKDEFRWANRNSAEKLKLQAQLNEIGFLHPANNSYENS